MLATSHIARRYILNLKSIAAILIIALGLSSLHCNSDAESANEMRQAIQRELPTGSSEEQVIKFLESKGISHSRPEFDGYDPQHKYGLQRVVMASITREVFAREWSKMLIVFYFDENKRLKHFEVKNT